MRGKSALVAVVALGAPAWAAPLSSVGLHASLEASHDASFAPTFHATSQQWDLEPAQTGFIAPRATPLPQPDSNAAPMLIPTPGTAALAALAGLVMILPRRRS